MFHDDFDWNNVGSFEALRDMASKDEHGNAVLSSRYMLVDSHGLTVHSNKKPMVALGHGRHIVSMPGGAVAKDRGDRIAPGAKDLEELK